MSVYASTLAVVLASPSSNDPGGQGPDFGKSSPLGLLVLILFFVAVAFLMRSMTKHLRRVPASFDQPSDGSTVGKSTKESSEAAKEQSTASAEPGGVQDAEPGGVQDKDKQERGPKDE
jgi:hypothetical protein